VLGIYVRIIKRKNKDGSVMEYVPPIMNGTRKRATPWQTSSIPSVAVINWIWTPFTGS